MISEYETRLTNLRDAVAKAELDAFLVTSTDSIYYLTGFRYEPFERAFFIVVRPEGDPVFVTPRIEAENMGTIGLEHQIVEYADYPAPEGHTYLDALNDTLAGAQTVGVEPTLPAELFTVLGIFSPLVRPLVENMRLVKSPSEIAAIQTAARYSDLGLKMILEVSRLGASIQEGYDRIPELRQAVIDGEGFYDPYISSTWLGVWAAPYSAQPHRFPEPSDHFGNGPNVGLSFLRVNGYSAETERTFFVHEPSAEQAEVFNTMLAACDIAYQMLRPGVTANDVDHAVMTFLRSEGFAENLLHRTGHGIGMGGHEGPWVAEGSNDILKENMVISVEPGIYWRGQGGYRHSDTVLITSDGYRKLTDFPADLRSMTLTS